MPTPTYDEIALLARSFWHERGCPDGRDTELWLEAERQLNRGSPPAGDQKSASFTERAKAETAAESVVEYQISPAGSDEGAIRAAMQIKDPGMPKAKPPTSRKTLSRKTFSTPNQPS